MEGNAINSESSKDFLVFIDERRKEGKALKGKCGFLNEFLWMCAGVDRDLIRTCNSERTSYAGIGANIFFSAIISFLSMIIAMKFVVDTPFLIVIISMLFALSTFFLIRFSVSSFDSQKPLMSGLPRIFILMFLGLIIAIPGEMVLFGDEISSYVRAENQKTILQSSNILAIDNQIEANHKEIRELDSCVNFYERQYQKVVILPQRVDSKVDIARLKPIEDRIDYSRNRIRVLHRVSDSLVMEKERIIASASFAKPSLSQSIRALYSVTEGACVPLICTSLLFILIMISPVLYKMMLPHGVYDMLINKERETIAELLKANTESYLHEQKKV